MPLIFKESQRFRHPRIWIILTVVAIITLVPTGFGLHKQIILGEKFGNQPMSDNGLIITSIILFIFFFALFLIFRLSNLKTEIDQEAIRYKFSPFQLRFNNINWDKIEKYKIITYSAESDFGGWGIKYRKGEKGHIVGGNKGIRLYLKNGEKIMIGTQAELEMEEFLNMINPPSIKLKSW
jgi:hypothetical protein